MLVPAAAPALNVSAQDLATLRSWSRSAVIEAALAERARIVACAAEGLANAQIAERLGVSRPTVILWRARFAEGGIDALQDRHRSGRPREGAGAPPDRIPLPNGSQPEGLAISNAGRLYTGSLADGTLYVGDVATGHVRVLVPGAPGRTAVGVEVRDRYVWVADGDTGMAWVFRRNGRLIRTYDFDPGGFVNDVVVTARAAYFTYSFEPFLYRVPLQTDGTPGGAGSVEARALTGDIVYQDGFNANGIDVDRGIARFVMAQSNTGMLFRVRPSGRTREIDLGSGSVESPDGVLLQGDVVFVVQNFLNQLATVRLSRDLLSGRVLAHTTDPDFDVPTSVAAFGEALYLVNARFTTPPTPDTKYWIAVIPRP